MKNYLFGLGAMLVGAGLMFLFTHNEANADVKNKIPEPFECSTFGNLNFSKEIQQRLNNFEKETQLLHCRSGKLSCGYIIGSGGVSCVSTAGLFK